MVVAAAVGGGGKYGAVMMCHQRDTEVVPSGWMVYERVFDPTLSGTRSAIYI